MTDVIISILWFATAGNWILSAAVFYFAFNGMHEMALMGSNLGLFGLFQGIGAGLMLILTGTIFGAGAVLISEITKIRIELQKGEKQ